MTTKLQSQIAENLRKTINENLPATVAEELKKYLTEAEEVFQKLKDKELLITKLTEEVQGLRQLKNREEYLSREEVKQEAERKRLKEEQREFEFKQKILELKERHAEERLQELRYLTERVFASNKVGYNVGFNIPNPMYSGNMHNSTLYGSGTLTQTEG